MTTPDHLPVLSKGKQAPGSGNVCAEQAVNWLVSGQAECERLTGHVPSTYDSLRLERLGELVGIVE
jgi:hypothetical protein